MQKVCLCCGSSFDSAMPGRTPKYCSRKCRDKIAGEKKLCGRKSLEIVEDLGPVPPPEVIAERARAQSYWQNLHGDPIPGRSALEIPTNPVTKQLKQLEQRYSLSELFGCAIPPMDDTECSQ